MKKLSVQKLIEFSKRSDRGKKTFVENIKSNKITPPKEEGGGHYWITSLSAVCNSYREGSFTAVDEKIAELQEKITNTKHTVSRTCTSETLQFLRSIKVWI